MFSFWSFLWLAGQFSVLLSSFLSFLSFFDKLEGFCLFMPFLAKVGTGWEGGGGDCLLLAVVVLCGWYIGYGLGTSLFMHPCRLQLFVSAFPLPGCLMQWMAYSLVVFRNAAASVVPP